MAMLLCGNSKKELRSSTQIKLWWGCDELTLNVIQAAAAALR